VAVEGVTVARRVTCWPDVLGLGVAVKAVEEFTLATVAVTFAEVLPANLLSPP